MRKTKSEAQWNKLTSEQRETLDQWLFEERQSYAAIFPRAQSELGFKGSISSLRRYYLRRDKERVTTEFTELRDELAALSGAPTDAAALWAASKKLLGRFLYQQMRKAPENVKEWASVAGLMVDNDRNELLRELKGEELKVRREALEFAKKKFQMDMVEQAARALPEIKELVEARKDPQTKDYEENALLNRVRREMFGVVWEVRPESPQEEVEMLAAKCEREARRKAEQEAEAERQRVQDELKGPQPPTPSSPYYQEYLAWKAKREAERQESAKAYQESLGKAKEDDAEQGQEMNAPPPRKPSKQYQEYLDKLKLWEEKRELLGWEEMPRPEWSGRWPMTEEDE